jgi:hypothetical protein
MTPPTNAAFLVAYPEFSKAPSALVTSCLARAGRRTVASVFADTDTANDACMLKAAILLFRSPMARELKAVSDESAFGWAAELYEMQRSATMGVRTF